MKLTRFEKARVISARALQLSLGAPPLIKSSGKNTPYDLARAEFESAKLPFVVLRAYPCGTTDRIELNEGH